MIAPAKPSGPGGSMSLPPSTASRQATPRPSGGS